MDPSEFMSRIEILLSILLWIGKGTCLRRNDCLTMEHNWQDPGCSHRVAVHVDNAVNISSPRFPCSLPRTVNCMWEVEVSKGKLVHLDFLIFDIPGHTSSGSCLEAFVEYGHYNDLDRRVVIGERLCGNLTRFRVTSTSSTYWLTLQRFWSSNVTSHKGLLVQVKQTSKYGDESDGDATVVAICAFLVPLFCAFPVYHCFKRMSEVNKRKRFLVRMARLRERDREFRQNAEMCQNGKGISVTEDKVAVLKTITDDQDGQLLAEFNLYQYLSFHNLNTGSTNGDDNNNTSPSTSNHI